ncbi:MAG: zf-HC2 domain-containing protein, partial [Planctomycetota bacterium]
MNPSSCAAVRETLPWFVGGDLEPRRAGAVREHLVHCRLCRSEAAALQQGVQRLQQAGSEPVAGVDDSFFADLQRRIVDEVRAAEAPVAAARGGAPASVWLALAAVLLVAAGFWVGRGSRVGDPGSGQAPMVAPAAFGLEPTAVPWS